MAVQRDPRLLYGAEIRQRILDDVANDISRLGKRRKVGRLVSVGIGDVEEIAVYIRGQARAAAAVGLPFDQQHWCPGELSVRPKLSTLTRITYSPGVSNVAVKRP